MKVRYFHRDILGNMENIHAKKLRLMLNWIMEMMFLSMKMRLEKFMDEKK